MVPTDDLRDQLRRVGFQNVSVLGRGVDGRLFTPARRSASLRRAWGVSDADPVILCVGRVAPEKNIRLAITAYRAMQQVVRPCRFVIVGDGRSEEASALAQSGRDRTRKSTLSRTHFHRRAWPPGSAPATSWARQPRITSASAVQSLTRCRGISFRHCSPTLGLA